jgi:hypothetical protein
MIEPTEKDIGRRVTYHRVERFQERGVITSFNDQYVFIRYSLDQNSKATKREDLEWGWKWETTRLSRR